MTEFSTLTCKKMMEFKDGSSQYIIAGTGSTGNTMTIPTTGDGSAVNASSVVNIISANNITSGDGPGPEGVSATYTKASRLFTLTQSGMSSHVVNVIFTANA